MRTNFFVNGNEILSLKLDLFGQVNVYDEIKVHGVTHIVNGVEKYLDNVDIKLRNKDEHTLNNMVFE